MVFLAVLGLNSIFSRGVPSDTATHGSMLALMTVQRCVQRFNIGTGGSGTQQIEISALHCYQYQK